MRKFKLLIASLALVVGGMNSLWATDYTSNLPANGVSWSGFTRNLVGGNGDTHQGANVTNTSPKGECSEMTTYTYAEVYNANTGGTEFEVSETLSVANGTYIFQLAAFGRWANYTDVQPNGSTVNINGEVFANDAVVAITSGTFVYYTVVTKVTDGSLKVGLRAKDGNKPNWWGYTDAMLVKVDGESNIDLTKLLVNPSFEANDWNGTRVYASSGLQNTDKHAYATGWNYYIDAGTSWCNCGGASNPSDGSYACELWAGSPTKFKVYQTIDNLPAGRYSIVADARTNNGNFVVSKYISSYAKSNGITAYSPTLAKSVVTDNLNVEDFHTLTANFVVTESGVVELGLESSAFMQFDNFRLTYLGDLSTPVDMTNYIINSDFINNKEVGWTSEGSGGNFNHNGAIEIYHRSNFKFYQNFSNLPVGKYEVSVQMVNGGGDKTANLYTETPVFGKNSTAVIGSCSGNFDAERDAMAADANYGKITVNAGVTDGTLTVGVTEPTNGSTWVVFDNFKLTFLGYDALLNDLKDEFVSKQSTANGLLSNTDYDIVVGAERTTLTNKKTTPSEETVAVYITAASELQEAINAFIAAKPNYDALANEIVKADALGISAAAWAATSETTSATALSNTQDLKGAEYRYVNNTYAHGVALGEWTTTGPTGSLSSEHYKGSGYSYLEQSSEAWGQSSWTIKYEQDLTLPAGNYVFKVAGRQADSDGVTLSLNVKNGETSLGSVSDFPKGNTGLGINTSGETDFTTGEGHEYVNSGNGRGWEWRFVKFSLASETTINVAVDAAATTSHMWVSFCDASILTDNEANISLIAYNIALNNAILARDNATYTIVKGKEKADLLAAIAADGSLDKTDKDAIDAAKDALVAATTAFTDTETVTAWNRLNASITTADAISATHVDATTAWESNTTTAATATSTANALYQTMLTDVMPASYTSGFEAGEYAPYNITAAKAFFTNDAVDATKVAAGTTEKLHSAITNCKANTGSVNAFSNGGNFQAGNLNGIGWQNNEWVGEESNYVAVTSSSSITYGNIEGFEMPLEANTVYELKFRHSGWDNSNHDGGGTVSVLLNNEGLAATDYVGNSTYDKGNESTYKNESFLFKTGAAGNYVLTLAGKGGRSVVKGFSILKAVSEAVTMDEAVAYTQETKFANVTLNRKFSADVWNTFVVPFDIDNTTLKAQFGDEVAVSTATLDNEKVTFTPMATPAITANVPVIIKVPNISSTNSYTFDAVIIKTGEAKVAGAGVDFVGNYAGKFTLTSGDYYIAQNKLKKATGSQYVNGFRAYFDNTASTARFGMFIDGEDTTTGIDGVEVAPLMEGNVFNLNGQRVDKAQKGLYIVNGKKVVVK